MGKEARKETALRFLRELGKRVKGHGTVYAVGGTSAVLLGWRNSTVDLNLHIDPEPEGVFEAIATLKSQLGVYVDLSSPKQFVPAVPGWEERSHFIGTFGLIEVKHFDFLTQALAKIERGSAQDFEDVRCMIRGSLLAPETILEAYQAARPRLVRYPGIHDQDFGERLQEFVLSLTNENSPQRGIAS